MVLILLAVSLVVLGATLSRTMTSSKLDDRNNLYTATGCAAEAATEKALTRMLVDYQIDSEALVISNMNIYQAAIPTSSENSYWTNFEFSDGQGHVGSNYVARISTNANAVYVQLQSQFAGLYGFASTYRILSNVRPLNSSYRFTNAVQQDIQLAEIPVFQFAIFYNSLLEFTWAAPLTVRGLVHCNTNIYIGSQTNLFFSNLVTTCGNITWPPWDGHTDTNDYSGVVKYYQATNGYLTGQPALTLPIGTNNSPAAVHAIIDPPPASEPVTSNMGKLRFYNNADMTIMVSNSSVTVNLKTSPTDAGTTLTNWNTVSNFMSTNITFYDERESKTVVGTQIDVGKFNTWMGTNSTVLSKFSSSLPLNIVYVADYRTASSSLLHAVRLTNAATLPPNGLTVATPGPLYIEGNYNCPSNTFLGTTNTTASVPSSVISDAVTILSPNWKDSNDANSSSTLSSRAATNATVNTAIITGVVYSTDATATGFSGGVVNMPRLLEDWQTSSRTLTLNTSMVNLYNSTWATNQWQTPGTYYYAPTRNFNFDQNFTQSSKLPPGTPLMHQLQRAVWCNPVPGTTGSTNVWIYNDSY